MLAYLEMVPVPCLRLNRCRDDARWSRPVLVGTPPNVEGTLAETGKEAAGRLEACKLLVGDGRPFSAASATRTAFATAATKVGSIGVETDREDMAFAPVDTAGEEDGGVGPEVEGSKTLAERLLLVCLVVTPSNSMADKKCEANSEWRMRKTAKTANWRAWQLAKLTRASTRLRVRDTKCPC